MEKKISNYVIGGNIVSMTVQIFSACESKIYPKYLICVKEWYEDVESKTGWSDTEWIVKDTVNDGKKGPTFIEELKPNYTLYAHIQSDKFGNPIEAVFELDETTI